MMRQLKPPTLTELYATKLITVLREGYGLADFRADAISGLTVAIVAVPFLDSTAASAMSRVATKAKRQGIRLYITGASPTVRRTLLTHGVRPPRALYRKTIVRAIAGIKQRREQLSAVSDGLAAKPAGSL